MASLPAITTPETSIDARAMRRRMALVARLQAGQRPADIAKRLSNGDRIHRLDLEFRMYRWINHDPVVDYLLSEVSQANLKAALPQMTAALARRGVRGRPDAIKLAMEACGFHNPKVKHDHTGEIKLTLSMPRPDRTEDIVDADVVED